MKAICFRCEQPLAIGSATCSNCGLEIIGKTVASQEAEVKPQIIPQQSSKLPKNMAIGLAVVLLVIGCFFVGKYAATRQSTKTPQIKSLPLVTIGKHNEDPASFMRRAYPGCKTQFNQELSSADGHLSGYNVTEPNGKRVLASLEFIPDSGQDNKPEGEKTGHFKLSEEASQKNRVQ